MTATTHSVQPGNELPTPTQQQPTRQPAGQAQQPTQQPTGQPGEAPTYTRTRMASHIFGGLARISLGFVFLWAFVDKMFGLGFATASEEAWIKGGSPTFGFLSFGAAGPFQGLYNDIAGAAWADWLFMLGLLAIGVALMLGVFMNLAAAAGALLLIMMWTAVLPPENNPVIDDHIIYALTLGLLATLGAGRWLGLGRKWEQTSLVKKVRVLR